MTEIWKDIPGYEGRYQASNEGRIKGAYGRVLKPGNCRGYSIVNISGYGTIAVHLLVARTFLPLPNETVNHKDGNKKNNALINLEWVTRSENQRHAVNTGLKNQAKAVKGIKKGKGNVELVCYFNSAGEAAYCVYNDRTKATQISRVCRGERKKYRGFIWKYV